nr:hypothetical protein [Tanacetum cinerariifolium]
MSDALRDIYRTLESRYVHEGRTINISFYNDLSDDSVAKFTTIGIYIYSDAWGLDELEKTLEQIKPYNSRLPALDDIQNLIHRRIVHEKIDKERNTIHKLPNHIETNELFNHLRPYNPSTLPTSSLGECTSLETERTKFYLMAKQPKKPPPKRTRNVGKSKRTQLSTSSSTESPASDNGEFPSTELSPWSYSGALKDDPNMSKEQRRQEGCSKTWVERCITFEEQPNERTPSPPPRKKSLSPPQAPSKSISSKSTHYTSSSSPTDGGSVGRTIQLFGISFKFQSEEQPNERTHSPPPRKKSLSPPQAPSKSISSKSTHYTSSSSPKNTSIVLLVKVREVETMNTVYSL